MSKINAENNTVHAPIGADALRVAAQAALTALENLDGVDTETECITIDVRDEIDRLRAELASAAVTKAASREPSTAGDTLAIDAFRRFGAGPYTITPYLSLDEPEGIRGYRFLCDALAMAFEAGCVSRGQAPVPAAVAGLSDDEIDAEVRNWWGDMRGNALRVHRNFIRSVLEKWAAPTPAAQEDALDAAPVAEVIAVSRLENESRELTPRIVPLTRDLQVGELLYRKPYEGADATRRHGPAP